MTIYERALDFIPEGAAIGLGSGRAATAFIQLLGERVKAGMRLRGVPTSQASADLATRHGVPLASLEDVMPLAVTVDGADEVDPHLNLIKGWGRALVREKVIAASSRQLVILVGPGKEVPALGTRGNLPVEVVPFALPLCIARLRELGLRPTPYMVDGKLFLSDNGNAILDCAVALITDPAGLEAGIRAIPGVVGTGLFLGMADVVLVGDEQFRLKEERRRGAAGR